MLWSLLTGFVVAIGLIVAIGAQNAWVLSQSMRGGHRGIIAMVCILCDAGLIILGVYGIQQVQALLPSLVPLLTTLGIALLLWLAWQAGRRAWQGTSGLQAAITDTPNSRWKTAGTALGITLLNPHVYLDTVVLIGSVGAQQAQPLWFTVGACLASLCWFSALTGFAPRVAGWLSSPARWRAFDTGMAGLLLLVAVSLVPL